MIDKYRIARLTQRLVAQKEAEHETRRSPTASDCREVGAVDGNISAAKVPVFGVVARKSEWCAVDCGAEVNS